MTYCLCARLSSKRKFFDLTCYYMMSAISIFRLHYFVFVVKRGVVSFQLYNVVVKDKHTARLIVETGLPHRRTFVPWTEVVPRHYHDMGQRFRRAQELVHFLILICDTIHCAKEVVYDSQVKLRAVTARGDDLKPTGTMSGGNLKRKQIDIDKRKLLDTIALLDIKKTQEIHKAYTQVNRDFGNIFSTLLPGASAKLEPPPGKTVEQGLEVKVAFNGKWKESLQELSGGQRSLVALSLVLAMLKFRPAPIYILDEVDAALDLSHTQNIGLMIKKHFTTSQFIIVSLKEGMFNHANVLYRTKFSDGTSQVVRTNNKSIDLSSLNKNNNTQKETVPDF
ncbi:unnamed protein product [Angiostrongylus costaricensis]|uniref:SMC_N domain-containing protein n=1 Tax=Angiostrongylus costaricensis TaxID=334426 RepID=A0A158PFN6_ANGCS|nr:unnamed protein product [Angiostrongylus costaricensis]